MSDAKYVMVYQTLFRLTQQLSDNDEELKIKSIIYHAMEKMEALSDE